MPNRIIKESICSSDKISKCNWFEEVLFYRLIVNCDDYGRFDGRTQIIKARLFPLVDSISYADIESAIDKLCSLGLVMRYANDGKPYLCLPTWEDNQNIRAHKSKYPAPADEEVQRNTAEYSCTQVNADESECARNPNPNPNPNPNQETENNPNLSLITNKSQETGINYEQVNILFDRLWKLYPKQVGKGQVTMDEKVAMFEIGFERVAKAIRAYRRECEESEREYKFIKNGSTFFNGAWRDYLPPAPPPRDPNKRYDEEGRELNAAGYPIIDFGLSKAGNDF